MVSRDILRVKNLPESTQRLLVDYFQWTRSTKRSTQSFSKVRRCIPGQVIVIYRPIATEPSATSLYKWRDWTYAGRNIIGMINLTKKEKYLLSILYINLPIHTDIINNRSSSLRVFSLPRGHVMRLKHSILSSEWSCYGINELLNVIYKVHTGIGCYWLGLERSRTLPQFIPLSTTCLLSLEFHMNEQDVCTFTSRKIWPLITCICMVIR